MLKSAKLTSSHLKTHLQSKAEMLCFKFCCSTQAHTRNHEAGPEVRLLPMNTRLDCIMMYPGDC